MKNNIKCRSKLTPPNFCTECIREGNPNPEQPSFGFSDEGFPRFCKNHKGECVNLIGKKCEGCIIERNLNPKRPSFGCPYDKIPRFCRFIKENMILTLCINENKFESFIISIQIRKDYE